MLDQIKTDNVLFLDIETVPQYSGYSEVPQEGQELWEKKSKSLRTETQTPEDVYSRAGIYCEFGKIICVSAGFMHYEDGQKKIRIKSVYGDDEKELLQGFINILKVFGEKKEFCLCAHNGKEFDFPYLARRILINGLSLPEVLDVSGKKPWEVKFIDTMELWKFGDYKHYTSLELLAYIFGISSPKDDIDGSMVDEVYYRNKDLPRIVKYCEKDVITTIQLLLKFKGESTVNENNIFIVG